jgi:hypothetical protein
VNTQNRDTEGSERSEGSEWAESMNSIGFDYRLIVGGASDRVSSDRSDNSVLRF